MKKLVVLAAMIVAGVAANAASFKWVAGNIYGSDGSTKWSGTVSLFAEGITDAIKTASASSGAINSTFSTDAVTGGNSYNFYMVIEDNDKTFTSSTVAVVAQATSTANILFGNMATATQNSANWVAVPEPTSGLLLLLGMAGLALKRKRA
jgi:hypothetical protein